MKRKKRLWRHQKGNTVNEARFNGTQSSKIPAQWHKGFQDVEMGKRRTEQNNEQIEAVKNG